MSAIVSGKRSFFEELSATPPVSKRIRCSSLIASSSSSSFSPYSSSSPPSSSPSSFFIDQLIAIFPEMDKQVLERALEECGDDLDSAIRSLNELRLGSADRNAASAADKTDVVLEGNVQLQAQGVATANGDVPTKEQTIPEVFSMDGSNWVELFVREMMNASNIDDARARATRALEFLEKSIRARAGEEVAQNFHQVSYMVVTVANDYLLSFPCFVPHPHYLLGFSGYWGNWGKVVFEAAEIATWVIIGKYDAEKTTGSTYAGKYYS
ncbi:hypothetical protein DITRI_Ditri07aG0040200 [Diplodiscus trichospermus]